MDPLSVMPFGDHLEELRKRLIWGLGGLIPILVVCLIFGGPLLKFLMIPLLHSLQAAGEPTQLLATSPLETFGAYIKVASVVAVIVTMPWLVYQLWLFVAPGLYAKERRFVYFLLPFSAFLTASGMVFLYKVLLPITLFFLIVFGINLVQTSVPTAKLPPDTTFASIPVLQADPPSADTLSIGSMWINETIGELRIVTAKNPDTGKTTIRGIRLTGKGAISQQYRIGDYIGLVFTLGLVFAVAFQLPLVLMLLSWLGILEAKDITPFRRHVILATVIVGAIFTPPDPGSQLALACTLLFLFELGVILMKFVPASVVAEGFGKEKRKRTSEDKPKTDADEGDE